MRYKMIVVVLGYDYFLAIFRVGVSLSLFDSFNYKDCSFLMKLLRHYPLLEPSNRTLWY